MMSIRKKILKIELIKFCLLLFLAVGATTFMACGDDNDNNDSNDNGDDSGGVVVTTISGTAATGSPIVGTVNIRGADGAISTSAIEIDGSFSVDVSALTAPFVMWAEGFSNGKTVKLYSTVDAPGKANITPATDTIMAIALGDDPDTVYSQDSLAAAPSSEDIEAAKTEITNRLSSVFATLDMPEDFDLMNGEFEADGTGFDKVLDTVDMDFDPDSNSVKLVDKVSDTVLFEKDVDTGELIVDLDTTEIDTIVTEGMSDIDVIRAMFDKIEELYVTETPTLEILQQEIRPYMADDFLDYGYGPDDTLESWTMGDEGPAVGIIFDSISIHRKMIQIPGTSLNEFGDHEYGLWAIASISVGTMKETVIFGFVKDGNELKWYGNRDPFLSGSELKAVSLLDIQPDGTKSINTGLDFYTDDEGNLAFTNYGITKYVIYNDGFPIEIDNKILMSKRSDVDTEYGIANIDTSLWDNFYAESDGLNIDNITDKEFIYVGLDSNDNPVATWINILKELPSKGSDLDETDFPVINSPTTLAGLNIPGVVNISWTNPSDTYVDWVDLWWQSGDGGQWEAMDQDNPAWSDSSLVAEDWTSTSFDTSETQLYPATYASIQISVLDDSGVSFRTMLRYE